MELIGDRIRRLRLAKRIKLKRFAEDLGVTSSAASQWETCKAYPTPEHIDAIAEYFDKTPDYIEYGDEPTSDGQCIPINILRVSLEEVARNYKFIDADPLEFSHAVTDYCLSKIPNTDRLEKLGQKIKG